MNLSDDGHCFVCGPKNPIGLKLDFHFNGETLRTEFTPKKEHQGYSGIVHGGILSTVLDETMVKLAIAMDMPAVTVKMETRLRKSLKVGSRIIIEAKIVKETRKILDVYSKAFTEDSGIVAEATGKLLKVK